MLFKKKQNKVLFLIINPYICSMIFEKKQQK